MVNPRTYVPQRGDIVWITLNPQAGHEQAGRHPAVVLSPKGYKKNRACYTVSGNQPDLRLSFRSAYSPRITDNRYDSV